VPWAGIVDIVSPAIGLFRFAVRLGGSGLVTQLYVGKLPISKRDRESIRKFMVLAFRGPVAAAPQISASVVGRP
jgi:hypothetical protein